MMSVGMKGGHRLAVAMALGLGLASQAQAIGLGAIEVKSQLGKPFVAEIPITLSVPNEANDLSVRLAAPDAFARVGLERPNDQAANLRFSIVKNARGELVVRISTPQPMNDPYVSFLLEADWGRGKMVREYTALLDPPRTTAVRHVQVMAPVVQSTPMPAAPSATAPVPRSQTAPMQVRPPAVVAMPASPPPPPPESAALPPPAPMYVAPMEIPPPIPVPPPRAEMSEPAPAPISAAPSIPQPPPAPVVPEPTPEPQPVAPAPAPMPESAPPAPEPVAPAPIASMPVAPTPAPQAEAAAPTPAMPDAVTVASGDTLSGIAGSLHREASVNRMMIALQRANPDAFINNNINLLKSGSVLRIPARQEVQTLSPDEANLLVQQQVESWHQSLTPSPQAVADTGAIERTAPSEAAASSKVETGPDAAIAQAPATPRKPVIAKRVVAKPQPAPKTADESSPATTSRATAARVSRAHLEIVPPVGTGASGSQTGASAGGSGNELRAELAQTKEDLAARTAEIGELKSRLSDLEKIQQDNQSLLSMKDSKLAELQQHLAELEKERNTALAAAAASSTAGAAAVDSPALAQTAGKNASATTSAKAIPARQDAAPVVEIPWYQRPLVLIGAGLLLLGSLLGLMLRGRSVPAGVPRTSRYSSGTLAASMASARATAMDVDAEAAESQAVNAAEQAEASPVATAAAASASAQPIRRPYWTGPNVITHKDLEPADASVAASAPPAPVSESTHAADASAGRGDDWGLDAAASAAKLTKQRPIAPAVEGDQGVATKMELARAYIDIGDAEGARGMLEEVLMEGNDSQRDEALKLLETLE